jgi:hypothetical protein
MPIRRSPTGACHHRPQVVAIARIGCPRSVGTGGRQSTSFACTRAILPLTRPASEFQLT